MLSARKALLAMEKPMAPRPMRARVCPRGLRAVRGELVWQSLKEVGEETDEMHQGRLRKVEMIRMRVKSETDSVQAVALGGLVCC